MRSLVFGFDRIYLFSTFSGTQLKWVHQSGRYRLAFYLDLDKYLVEVIYAVFYIYWGGCLLQVLDVCVEKGIGYWIWIIIVLKNINIHTLIKNTSSSSPRSWESWIQWTVPALLQHPQPVIQKVTPLPPSKLLLTLKWNMALSLSYYPFPIGHPWHQGIPVGPRASVMLNKWMKNLFDSVEWT